jgi:hypothetical protein
MNEDTATPETGPVDASNVMESVLAELTEDKPQADAADDVVAELVKETEDEGQAQKAPDAEESATDPIDEEEEPDADPPKDDEETDAAPADDPIVKVKVNGEEVEVPLSEALAGYSRNEDYKAKTMALADERREVEALKANIEPELKRQYANELKQKVDMFEALDPVLSEARQIDWDRLKAEDPATFVQYSDAVSQRLALIEQHREQIRQIEQQQAEQAKEAAQAEYQQRLTAAADKIVAAMPELAEGDNFQRFATDSIGYLRETGFTPEEINEAIDDRVLTLADKARRWDALQRAKKGLPAKKVVPKSQVKPLTSDASDSSRSSRRLPRSANRDQRVDFVVNELLSRE